MATGHPQSPAAMSSYRSGEGMTRADHLTDSFPAFESKVQSQEREPLPRHPTPPGPVARCLYEGIGYRGEETGLAQAQPNLTVCQARETWALSFAARSRSCHGCCWETFYLLAYCALVAEIHPLNYVLPARSRACAQPSRGRARFLKDSRISPAFWLGSPKPQASSLVSWGYIVWDPSLPKHP